MSAAARLIRITEFRAGRESSCSLSNMSAASRMTVRGLRSSWLASRVKPCSRSVKASRRSQRLRNASARVTISSSACAGRRSAPNALASGEAGSKRFTCEASWMTGETARREARYPIQAAV